MDDNNAFFDSYKKKASGLKQAQAQEEEAAAKSSAAASPAADMKYNMESGFVKPEQQVPAATAVPNSAGRFIAPIAGAAILLFIVFGVIFFLNRGVEIIDFTGWTENDAQLWARNQGVMLQVEREHNDDYEAGKIFVQHTESGNRVKKGSFVLLGVSLGPDQSVTLPLPDIKSMSKDEIDQWAAQNHMSRVRVAAEYSEEVPADRVIRYEINDDRVVNDVRRDSPIYVIISRGPEDRDVLITLPNFREMPLAQCHEFANEHGLVLAVEEEFDDFIPEGNIISQSIKADETVTQGTEIALVVSRGKMISVPNFAGYNQERAMAVAGGLGIQVVINERYSGASAGSFLSQSIPAGRVYESGDILELTYSIGNQIIISSFEGSTQDAIENWAGELNDKGARIKINVTNTRSNSPKGTIISQDKANMAIGINTTVNVIVSSGRVVYVPDLVAPAGSGYGTAITREKAIAICEDYNIIPVFVAEAKSGRLPGEIWSQSLPAGSETTEGTTITLKYVPANVRVTVPDFTGMTRANIQNGNYDKMLEIRYDYSEAGGGSTNKVTAQSLRAATKVASGSIITLTISP